MGQQASPGYSESGRPPVTTDVQTMLAEYAALRAEVERRSTVQWNVFALQVTSAGAIASLAISTSTNVALLLIIPLSSTMLGGRYILHDFHIKLINQYISDSLSPRLDGQLQWGRWKNERMSTGGVRRWFGVTRWNTGHPTRLAFEGVAVLALVAAALAATYTWWTRPPQWPLIAGFVLIWILGASATWQLHHAFNRASRP